MVYQVLPEGHKKARQQSKRQQERLSCGEQSELPDVGPLVSQGGVPNRIGPRLCTALEMLLMWPCRTSENVSFPTQLRQKSLEDNLMNFAGILT